MSKQYQSPRLAPGVKDFMLDPEFWIKQSDGLDQPVIKGELRKDFVQRTYQRAADMGLEVEFCQIKEFPRQINRNKLLDMMEDFSKSDKLKEKSYYNIEGKKISEEKISELIDNSAIDQISDEITVSFGLLVNRSNMRAYPTNKVFATRPEAIDQDMFQLTALSVGTPLAILHVSRDKSWCFVQVPYYRGWIKSKNIALVNNKQELVDYIKTEKFLIVTESIVETEPNPFIPDISNIEFQMGDMIPLMCEDNIPDSIPPGNQQAQSPEGCYVIKLPVRNQEGYLELKPALIARSRGVREGFLPYTRKNLIFQAFKMLGERYGWGGLYKRRDCSRFIMDIYRSVGIKIPRDAGKPQEEIATGKTIEFTGNLDKRRETMTILEPGDPIYMKGHVVMYLGQYNDNHYVIHSGAGYGRKDNDGNITPVTVHGVFVMSVDQYLKSGKKSYLEAFKLARKFK